LGLYVEWFDCCISERPSFLTTIGNFSFNTIAGQGYIAIAAVSYGRWESMMVSYPELYYLDLPQAI